MCVSCAKFAVALALALAAPARADPPRYDLVKAWFKPELALNRQPEVCVPLFKRYVEHFLSGSEIDPMVPAEGVGPGAVAGDLRELEWETLGSDQRRMRIARWRQDGKPYAVIELARTHGWRPTVYQYYFADREPTEDEIDGGKIEAFTVGSMFVLRPAPVPNRFDVISWKDPRLRDYEKNLFTQFATVFESGKQVYVSVILSGGEDEPTRYAVLSLIAPRQVEAVCRFTTLPSSTAQRAEAEKIVHFREFEDVVQDIMGGGGDCGTMNAPGRAYGQLREGLGALIYRPWLHALGGGGHDFADWGYSGPWNYRKYRQYLAARPKAIEGLAEKYARDYKLSLEDARNLAENGIDSVLGPAFDHGRIEDPLSALHRALLEGSPADEVDALLAPPAEIDKEENDGTLAYALGHPRLVELLLKRGFNPNATNAFGKTPLMYAAQFNDLESARLLVAHGANTELATVQPMDRCGYTIQTHHVTALHYAVRYASRPFVEWLVGAGAVSSVRDSNGRAPLDYLTSFGGFVGYQKPADTSYGRQNPLLAKADIDTLAKALEPPSDANRMAASDEANRNAEALYRAGKIPEAFQSVKRALSLNPVNERAMANLSLVALRLGQNAESAKAATYVIEKASSPAERANAYFNLGLACRAEGDKGFHYASIFYDGAAYCQERSNRYHGPLYYFLKAYQTLPNARRASAIVEFLRAPDPARGKWLCRASDEGAALDAVYVTNSAVYFLGKTGAPPELRPFARRERGKQSDLEPAAREEIALGNGLSVFQWQVGVPFQGVLVMGGRICGRYLGELIEDGLDLVEVVSMAEGARPVVTAEFARPTVVVLYGNEAKWTMAKGSRNVRALYLYGKGSSVSRADASPAEVKSNVKQAVFREAWGSSFNSYTETTIGLPLTAIVETKNNRYVPVNDALIAGLPRCEGRVRSHCRLR
jgi:tetratricopeptide (TPR) repeat protein